MATQSDCYTIFDLAAYLGENPQTTRRAVRAGAYKGAVRGGGRRRPYKFPVSTLAEKLKVPAADLREFKRGLITQTTHLHAA